MSAGPLEFASVSHMGQVRQNNEDAFGEFVDGAGARLLVVCDGMGGHQAGERASHEAVARIGEVFRASTASPDERLRAAFETANAHVHQLASESPTLRGMGTTGVGLLFDGSARAWVVHVGDSRAYRVRRGEAEQLTRDHSLVARMVAEGALAPEEAAAHPMRNELLRSLGVDPEVEVDVGSVDVEPGDHFVLCSDGLFDVVAPGDIAALAVRSAPAEAAKSLVDLANSRGAPDNVTVQVARVPGGVLAVGPSEATTRPLESAPIVPPPQVFVERVSKSRVLVLAGVLGLVFAAGFWVVRWLQAPEEPLPGATASSVAPLAEDVPSETGDPPPAAPAVAPDAATSAAGPGSPTSAAGEAPAAPAAGAVPATAAIPGTSSDEKFPEGWQPPIWIPAADADKGR